MHKLLAVLFLTIPFIPAQASEIVAEGAWRTFDYDVEGTWHIVQADDRLTVRLGDDFVTKNGPDLHVLLSPKPFAALNNDNAMEDALVAGLLVTRDDSTFFRKMKGAQSFMLPAGTRLADYQTIVIIHMWTGAIWLAMIPFTRIAHMLFFPLTRAYMGSEFGHVRGTKDW